MDRPEPIWRRGSFCSGNGDCVEVAMAEGSVLVRGSTDPRGTLQFSRGEWTSFVAAVKAGQFDPR
jgi:Domain of unknown function (DUF397)